MHLNQRKPNAATTTMHASDRTYHASNEPCLEGSPLLERLFITGFDSSWESEITSAVCVAYERSRTLRRLLDAWLAASERAFTIRHVSGACSAEQGIVEFDPAVPHGVRSEPDVTPRWGSDQVAALLHAVSLALQPKRPPKTTISEDPADATLADHVLEEMCIPRQFATVRLGSLALATLSYERRWQGSPFSLHWKRTSAGSNVIHVRRIPASLPCSDDAAAVAPDVPRQASVQSAVALLGMDLTRDLVGQPCLDIEFLNHGGDLWRWDFEHPQRGNNWLGA
jgi:hypothetical protein